MPDLIFRTKAIFRVRIADAKNLGFKPATWLVTGDSFADVEEKVKRLMAHSPDIYQGYTIGSIEQTQELFMD